MSLTQQKNMSFRSANQMLVRTPGSKLGYLAAQDNFMGAKLFIGTPKWETK